MRAGYRLAPMKPVNRSNPCPVCGKSDWCLIATDGEACICGRVESPKPVGGAGFLHVIGERRNPLTPLLPRVAAVAGRPSETEPSDGNGTPLSDHRMLAEGYSGWLTAERADALASLLGLPANCIDAVDLIGWCPDEPLGPCWTLPEWDDRGRVVGLMRRFPKPDYVGGEPKNKLRMGGHKCGVTLPHGWREAGGPVLLVEGASDMLAAAAAGLTAIGRPSNRGGGDILRGLLSGLSPDRPVIVVGENDRKPEGTWPGRDGADSLARKLAADGIPVSIVYPPEPHKDTRDWIAALAEESRS